MPWKDPKDFIPHQQIPRVPSDGREFPGGPPVTTSGGNIFTDIFNKATGGIFGGHIFPANIPIHPQGMPAPDTGPASPQISGGMGEVPNQNAQSSNLFDILMQLAMGQGLDPKELSKQAMAAASQQYDPQIEELKREMGITEQHAGRSQQQIGQMYGALKQSDLADIPQIDEMFNQSKNKVGQQYQQLGNQVSSQYANAQKQQMDLMKQLNIQAAAPDALKAQQSDQAFFQGQQGQSKQDTLDAMSLLQQGADDYSRQGSEIAGLEGNNRQADVMAALQDYMTQAQGKVGDLEAQKQNGYTSALSQLAQQQQQGQQTQFGNILQLAKMQYEMQHDQDVLAQQKTGKQPTSGPLAAAGYLGQADPSQAGNLNGFLLSLLQQEPFTSGQMKNPFDPTRSQQLTPEAAAQLAVQQAASQGMSPQSQQELYMAMLAYYGRM